MKKSFKNGRRKILSSWQIERTHQRDLGIRNFLLRIRAVQCALFSLSLSSLILGNIFLAFSWHEHSTGREKYRDRKWETPRSSDPRCWAVTTSFPTYFFFFLSSSIRIFLLLKTPWRRLPARLPATAWNCRANSTVFHDARMLLQCVWRLLYAYRQIHLFLLRFVWPFFCFGLAFTRFVGHDPRCFV